MKVICDKEDIVAIADSVRNKTGTTDQMTLGEIKTRINEISGTEDLSAELAAQAEVIAQLEEAVAEKAAGSSGGGNIETCTVILGRRTILIACACLITYTQESGFKPLLIQNISNDTTIEHVVCGSIIAINTGNSIIPAYAVTGDAENIYIGDNYRFWCFSVPKNPTETVSIIIRDDD